MARVCGRGDVAGGMPRDRARSARMAQCSGPGARQVAQAQAAQHQASPCKRCYTTKESRALATWRTV
eukprot:3737905-Prymnesium_polylepis.1